MQKILQNFAAALTINAHLEHLTQIGFLKIFLGSPSTGENRAVTSKRKPGKEGERLWTIYEGRKKVYLESLTLEPILKHGVGWPR